MMRNEPNKLYHFQLHIIEEFSFLQKKCWCLTPHSAVVQKSKEQDSKIQRGRKMCREYYKANQKVTYITFFCNIYDDNQGYVYKHFKKTSK